MRHFLRRLIVDDLGQDLAEYGIALAVIGSAAALAAVAIGGNVSTLWTAASTQVALVAGN